MTGTFYQCDACGKLEKVDELPKDWISIKLNMRGRKDCDDDIGFYWYEFHVCSCECGHKLLQAKKDKITRVDAYLIDYRLGADRGGRENP